MEYVLLSGVNDSREDAWRLAALLRGHVVTVNLLPWNAVCSEPESMGSGGHGDRMAAGLGPRAIPGTARASRTSPGTRGLSRPFRPSAPAAVVAFRAALRAAHIEAVVRQSKGAGIEAACGQLAAGRRSYEDGIDEAM